jgi:hypothetical protein
MVPFAVAGSCCDVLAAATRLGEAVMTRCLREAVADKYAGLITAKPRAANPQAANHGMVNALIK